EKRIAAHVEGLLVGGAHLPDLLGDKLDGAEADAVFAAAYPLLRSRRPEAAKRVGQALPAAEGPKRQGLVAALCHGPIDDLNDELRKHLTGPAPLALTAATILQAHGTLGSSFDLTAFVK